MSRSLCSLERSGTKQIAEERNEAGKRGGGGGSVDEGTKLGSSLGSSGAFLRKRFREVKGSALISQSHGEGYGGAVSGQKRRRPWERRGDTCVIDYERDRL